MDKPRVVFPFIEAGLGHITPMRSIADAFERLYGDRVEVVRSHFFTETGDKKLKAYERKMINSVRAYNKSPAYGFLTTANMNIFGTKICSWAAITLIGCGATKRGVRHMRELEPDLVFSTHWATNYYAMKIKGERPLTAMYCPDCIINPLFRYPCDLTFASTKTGYEHALKRHKRRYKKGDLKLVPFLIREEAFSVETDKRLLRQKLGLEREFTLVLADGGYGIGKMKPMIEEILKRDIPINVVAVCGKNEKLFEKLLKIEAAGRTRLYVKGLVDNMLEYVAVADVTCGKSGASLMAEPCFFGVPHIITHYANNIESNIGKYYIDVIGSAVKQFNAKKAVDIVEGFYNDPKKMQPYIEAARANRENFGADKCARYVFGLLCKKFPNLRDGTELE